MDGNDLQALMNEDDSTEDVEQLLAGAQKGKFFKKILDVGKKAVETVKESVKTVVTKGIDYFKNKATEWAKGMLNKVIGKRRGGGGGIVPAVLPSQRMQYR